MSEIKDHAALSTSADADPQRFGAKPPAKGWARLSDLNEDCITYLVPYLAQQFRGHRAPHCDSCKGTATDQQSEPCVTHPRGSWLGGYRDVRSLALTCKKLYDMYGLQKKIYDHLTAVQRHSAYTPPIKDVMQTIQDIAKKPRQEFLVHVKEFSCDFSSGAPFVTIDQRSAARDFIKHLAACLLRMPNLNKLLLDLGSMEPDLSAYVNRLYVTSFRGHNGLDGVEQLTVGSDDWGIFSQCRNVKHVATCAFIRDPWDHGEDIFSYYKIRDDPGRFYLLMGGLAVSCMKLESLDVQSSWNQKLMDALVLLTPQLKRLSIRGVDRGSLFSGPRTKRSTPVTFGQDPFGRHIIRGSGLVPEFLHSIAGFTKLETLVLPFAAVLDIFEVPEFYDPFPSVDPRTSDKPLFYLPDDSEYDKLQHVQDDEFQIDCNDYESIKWYSRLRVAYELIAQSCMAFVPQLKEVWISRFRGVHYWEDTSSIKDVRITLRQGEQRDEYKIEGGMKLDRIEDGKLPY